MTARDRRLRNPVESRDIRPEKRPRTPTLRTTMQSCDASQRRRRKLRSVEGRVFNELRELLRVHDRFILTSREIQRQLSNRKERPPMMWRDAVFRDALEMKRGRVPDVVLPPVDGISRRE